MGSHLLRDPKNPSKRSDKVCNSYSKFCCLFTVRGTFRNTDFQVDHEGPNMPATQAPPTGSQESSQSNDSAAELAALRETIEKVRQGPPSLPSILLYSLINAYQG